MFRPRLNASSKVFQTVLVHLVHNSALILTPCYFFILVSHCSQFYLYLLSFFSTGPTSNSSKIFYSLRGQKVWIPLLDFVKNFISIDVNRFCPVLPANTAPLAGWQESSQFPVSELQISRKLGGSFLSRVSPSTCYISLHYSTLHFPSSSGTITAICDIVAMKSPVQSSPVQYLGYINFNTRLLRTPDLSTHITKMAVKLRVFNLLAPEYIFFNFSTPCI